MGSQFDLGSSGSRSRLRDEFLDGLEFFKSDDCAAALALFRKADESAAIDDVYQNRYTSFHGLARLTMGDDSGVKLCRKAAVGETNDAEVYYNLAWQKTSSVCGKVPIRLCAVACMLPLSMPACCS